MSTITYIHAGIVVELDTNTAVLVVEGDHIIICVSVVTVRDGLSRNATFTPTQIKGTACKLTMFSLQDMCSCIT